MAHGQGSRSRKADGRALGIAVHRSFLTYVAVVVAVAQSARSSRADGATMQSNFRDFRLLPVVKSLPVA